MPATACTQTAASCTIHYTANEAAIHQLGADYAPDPAFADTTNAHSTLTVAAPTATYTLSLHDALPICDPDHDLLVGEASTCTATISALEGNLPPSGKVTF